MSWINNLEQKLSIVTGDGKVYTPLWKNATKDIDYNVSVFDFPNLTGSKVSRRKQRGRVFSVELYFTGATHLQVATNFEISCKDARAWRVSHPYYGNILCQPVRLKFDNSKHNVTVITGEVIETIGGVTPVIGADPLDEITFKVQQVNESSVNAIINNVDGVLGSDLELVSNQTNALNRRYSIRITDPIQANEFSNAVRSAKSLLAMGTGKLTQAFKTVQTVAQFPARFNENARDRVRYLLDEFNRTRLAVFGLSRISLNQRKFYEGLNSDLLVGAFLASASPRVGDYETKSQVLRVSSQLVNAYSQYLQDLDTLQDISVDRDVNYVPDFDNINLLDELFGLTISNLELIALESKTEVELILEEDSNVINLTNRFYGMDIDDENLNLFIRSNDIGINELLEVKKGRKLVYYV